MRPQPRLLLGALARLLAFVGLAFAAAVVLGGLWYVAVSGRGTQTMLFDSIVTSVGALLAGVVLIRFADHRSPRALGIGLSRGTLRHVLLGAGIGAASLAVAATALLLTRTLGYVSDSGTVAQWTRTVVSDAGEFTVAAFAEEIVFRGYAFQLLVRAAGAPAATVLSSAGFAAAHGANPDVSVFALLNIFLAGVLLALAYLKTLSLWFATALHMGWNWAMATLFDLPVSGLAMFDTPLYEPVVSGAAWWSGRSFGPEGGLVGTLGFAVALFALMRMRSVRPDAQIAAARPLVLPDVAPAPAMETVNGR